MVIFDFMGQISHKKILPWFSTNLFFSRNNIQFKVFPKNYTKKPFFHEYFIDISHKKYFSLYVPVIELEDYFEEIGEQKIEEIWYLQRYVEGWGTGFVERQHERDCIENPQYQTDKDKKYRGWFFGYDATHAENFKCVSVQGFSSILVEPLNGGNTTATSVMLDRAENLLHKYYGQYEFWAARRSMVFAEELRAEAATFRQKNLGWLNSEKLIF